MRVQGIPFLHRHEPGSWKTHGELEFSSVLYATTWPLVVSRESVTIVLYETTWPLLVSCLGMDDGLLESRLGIETHAPTCGVAFFPLYLVHGHSGRR